MRPNPLIPTRTAIASLRRCVPCPCRLQSADRQTCDCIADARDAVKPTRYTAVVGNLHGMSGLARVDVRPLHHPHRRSSPWSSRRGSSTRRCATASTSPACRSGSATCRCRSTSTPSRRSGFTPCRSASCSPRGRSSPALRERHPGLRLFLSTTTMSAQQLARRSVPDADAVFYFPFDLGLVVRRTLDLVKPRLFLMMETEIWPNLLRECRRPRRQDRGGQRPAVVAVVSALPAWRAASSAASSPTSTASACSRRSRRGASSRSAPRPSASPSPAASSSIRSSRPAAARRPGRATACSATSASRRRGRCSSPAAP